MLKFTDPKYFLSEVSPLVSRQVFDSGRNEPMLITGVCKTTNNKADYVIKYKGAPQMSISSSCFELISCFVGIELGLNIAEPSIIDVTPDFLGTLKGKTSYNIVSKSLGKNFGNKFVPGLKPLVLGQYLDNEQINQAKDIFSFDILISNIDRSEAKPNLSLDGESIFIFDHELAFSFIFSIINNPTPWDLNGNDMLWIKRHVFYKVLRGKGYVVDSFVEKFNILNDFFWEKVYETIPREWLDESRNHIEQIKTNLVSLIENRSKFTVSLNKLLS